MPELATDSLKIYYEERGAGAPVLFISGTGGDLRSKPNVLDGPLPQIRRTIAYDQRGLGQTEKPEGPYSMAQYGDDAAALLDALDLDRVDVVGVSFGGMVALHLALMHPEKVNRLVLCCTSPGGAMPSYPFHELPDDMTATDRVQRLMGINDTRLDAEWQAANPHRIEQMLDYAREHEIADHQLADFKRGARLQLLARAEHDVMARLVDIDAPVLICAGKYDGIAPAANQETLHDAIRGSELEWFEGGHLFLIQDKSAWPRIIEFLDPA